MTPSQRTELERKAKSATPGLWADDGCYIIAPGYILATVNWHSGVDYKNTDYIAACSPDAILSLLSALTEAEGRVEAARNAALEEAAMVVDEYAAGYSSAYLATASSIAESIARVIRALKPGDRNGKKD